METPIKMDDLGYHYFLRNIHMNKPSSKWFLKFMKAFPSAQHASKKPTIFSLPLRPKSLASRKRFLPVFCLCTLRPFSPELSVAWVWDDRKLRAGGPAAFCEFEPYNMDQFFD